MKYVATYALSAFFALIALIHCIAYFCVDTREDKNQALNMMNTNIIMCWVVGNSAKLDEIKDKLDRK